MQCRLATLDVLLHPDFVGVGPYGFVLDREQWLARFGDGLHYDAFEFTRLAQPRSFDSTSIVIGTQSQRGAYNGRPVEGVFRASIVLVGAQASIAHMQLSLGSPPGMPGPSALPSDVVIPIRHAAGSPFGRSAIKKPARASARTGSVPCSLVVVGRNQGACLPERTITRQCTTSC